MIWRWIYLTYVLVFISGTTAETGVGVGVGVLGATGVTIQILDDFTFVLVHNLSEIKDWDSFFSQLPALQSQVSMFGQKPQIEGQTGDGGGGGGVGGGSPNTTSVVQIPSLGQTQKPVTESTSSQIPPQTETTQSTQNPDQTTPASVDYETTDQDQVMQKPTPMNPTVPPETQQPMLPKPVPMQQPIPPKPGPMQQPIPQKPIQQQISQRPFQQQIPQKPTSIYQLKPQRPSYYTQQSQQKPFTARPVLSQMYGLGQQQIPQKPVAPQQPAIPQKPTGGSFEYQQKIPPDELEPEPATTTEKPNQQLSFGSESCGLRGVASSSRIVGGADAGSAEFPWQLSLQLMSGPRARHICGAAVVSAHWAITAAHCIWEIKPEQLSVVAGDHDLYVAEGHEQRVNVARIVVNKYKRETFTNDVAMLQLVSPLNVDYKYIAPICLPEPTQRFLKGDSIVTGWGRLSENGALPHVLQHVTLPILSLKRCHSLYRKAGYTKFIHTCQLCSGFELGAYDSCQGDSGGPLACKQADGRYYLCGIVSWGVGCARPKFPGVYTEITCYVEWIKHIINNDGNVLNKAPSVVSIPSNTRAWRAKTTVKGNMRGKNKPHFELEENLEEEDEDEDGGIFRRRVSS